MSQEGKLEKALFVVLTGERKDEEIKVHFNPESLDLTLSNTLQEQGAGDAAKQYVSQSTSKLALSLIYDTTHTGEDVRSITEDLASLMGGVKDGSTSDEGGLERIAAVIRFDWGAFTFQGMIEQYKEVVDLFSREGVPLRSTISLTLAKQDTVFQSNQREGGPDQAELTKTVTFPKSSGESVTDVASKGGDAKSARKIASQNGLSSLRSGASGSLSFNASAGGSVGGAISVGGSASAGLSGGLGASVEASVKADAAGGAFADLRTGSSSRSKLRTSGLLSTDVGAGLPISGGQFALGGRSLGVSGGLSADVGASTALSSRLRFDPEDS